MNTLKEKLQDTINETDFGSIKTKDGLQNLVTALGTTNDKNTHNRWIYQYVSWMELGAAYRENWLARQIVDAPVQDSIREWRKWSREYEHEMAAEESRLHVKWHFSQALKWARLYGGSAIVMIHKDCPLDEPRDVTSTKKDQLERLVTLDRWEMSPVGMEINQMDRMNEDYYIPEFYTVRGGTQIIHLSHMVRIEGAIMPPQIAKFEQGWGDSELRKCFRDIKDAVSMKMGIASLVQEASVDIIKRQGLADALSTGQEDAIKKRYQSFNMMKSNNNLGLLDATEEYERKEINFAGLSNVMEQMFTWVSGASGIPLSRLFGTSARGMNPTEDDDKQYFNDVKAKQENQYRFWLRNLDEAVVRSLYGEWPEDLTYRWNPLATPSSLELQTSMLSKAQRDQILLEQGVINELQVAESWKSEDLYKIDEEWLCRLAAGVEEMDVVREIAGPTDEELIAMGKEQATVANRNGGGDGNKPARKNTAADQKKRDSGKAGVKPRDKMEKGKATTKQDANRPDYGRGNTKV